MSLNDQSRTAWRTSTYSSTNGGECVEVAALSAQIGVRDSKNPEGPLIVFAEQGWTALISRIKNGEHELP
ncbi:DUF397 domain-containing protein [Spirillospora sp. NPDC048911]|uniref:DUF397 domain-containing protein n=1 Tax=Spirillospora sp. NPDC048911 TaxID=3364527 RepID=UPI0037125517